MLEFLLAFPLVLIAVLAIVQLSLLAQAKLFVGYAAFNAARTAIVGPDNQDDITEAAVISMTPISPRVDALSGLSGLSVVSGSMGTVAGVLGDAGSLLLRYAYAREFTDAKVVTDPGQSDNDITVHVDYLALLSIPIINRIIGKKGSGILGILSRYTDADKGWMDTIASAVGGDYFYPLSSEVTMSVESSGGAPAEDPSTCVYTYVDRQGVKHTFTIDEVYQSGTYRNGRPQYHTDKDKTGISRIVRQECP